jgi:hypothetical protein
MDVNAGRHTLSTLLSAIAIAAVAAAILVAILPRPF